MKIYCKNCNILVGDLLEGSKIRKGLVYLCEDCAIDYNILPVTNIDSRNYSDSQVEQLMKMFGMLK